MTRLHSSRRQFAVGLSCLAVTLIGVSGCGGSSKKTGSSGAATSSTSAAAAGGGSVTGQADTAAICRKLPVSDAQVLIRPKLSTAVVDARLGGCVFLLPGQQDSDSNLNVDFQTGSDGASAYQGDLTGTTSIGGTTVTTGLKLTTPLAGVGDKAVWGATAGEYPTVSALKGDVYCNVSIPTDGTKLAIIGDPTKPLPDGTSAQQLQYAQLEGKLCTDLFGLVH